MTNTNGKGSTRRPQEISHEEYSRRWEMTFRRPQDASSPSPQPPQESAQEQQTPTVR
jgi:hypothetical protein